MNKKILVIDDDEFVLKSVRSIGKRENWTTTACQDAEQGLQEVQKDEYDCIILDVRMPGMSGPQMLTALRGLEAEKSAISQRVIIITGFSDADSHIKVFQQDISHYLTKPFNVADLVAKVNQCYKSRQAQKAFAGEVHPVPGEEKAWKKIHKLYDAESLNKNANTMKVIPSTKAGCEERGRMFREISAKEAVPEMPNTKLRPHKKTPLVAAPKRRYLTLDSAFFRSRRRAVRRYNE